MDSKTKTNYTVYKNLMYTLSEKSELEVFQFGNNLNYRYTDTIRSF